MNGNIFRPARLLSFVLAATVAFAPMSMAADPVNEQDARASVLNETDAPVIVSREITGTALGLGEVEALGVNVRENPNMDAEIVTVVGQDQKILVLSKEGDWYRVSVDGVNGFVHSDYMAFAGNGSAEIGYGLVKASSANVRVSPDSESDALTCLSQEDVVTITGIVDGWYEVDRDGQTGYVRSDLIDPTAEIPAEKVFDYAVIEGTAVNLRTEPDASSEKADVLYSGSLCTLIQQVGDWYEVQYGDSTGYIYAPLANTTNEESDGSTEVETLNEAAEREAQEAAAAAASQSSGSSSGSSASYDDSYDSYDSGSSDSDSSDSYSYEEPSYEAPASTGGGDIVSTAMQYLGYAYVWGGTSPSGFDCSGFVQYVFRQCGYSISRTCTPQYNDGYSVAYSDLQPGDLVFFSGTYATSGLSHVGIYIGGGEFIHAANSRDGVKISSFSESYYSSHYACACRIA